MTAGGERGFGTAAAAGHPAAAARAEPAASARGGQGPQGTEALLRSTLDALSAHIAVLDRSGTIVAVNRAWRDFAAAGEYAGADDCVGTSYLAVCERGAGASEGAARTLQGLREIMAGQRNSFRMEYSCRTPQGQRWFQLRMSPAAGDPERRIVVAHEDITEIKRAEESLARLNARLLRLQDEERRHIARELHDTTAQNLLAISLGATRLQARRGAARADADGAMAEIIGLAEQSLQEVRTLCYLLHPPLLDDIGLEAALRWLARGLAERSGIATETRIEPVDVPLGQDAATALFRVAQEALLNVHRHSGSAWARLSLRCRDGEIRLEIEDSGRGLAAAGRAARPAVGSNDAGGEAGGCAAAGTAPVGVDAGSDVAQGDVEAFPGPGPSAPGGPDDGPDGGPDGGPDDGPDDGPADGPADGPPDASPESVPPIGVGISGMRVRLGQLGGRLELRERNPGLLVRAVLPLDQSARLTDDDLDKPAQGAV